MTRLEQIILATLIYYDVLKRPLTAWEVFKYLVRKRSDSDSNNDINFNVILKTLEDSPKLLKLVSQKNGFYFLKNRKYLIRQRIERQKQAERKWKKLKKISRLLEIIPFIRMVMISGSLALNNSKQNSDIDLLVVAKKDRIWSSRAATAFLTYVCRQYRHGQYIKNRLCLNHFITDFSLRIPCFSLYNAQTYAHLVPLWQTNKSISNSFYRENNWLKDYLYFHSEDQYLKRVRPSAILRMIKQIAEFVLSKDLGNFLENYLRKIQKGWFENDPLRYEPGGRIIFNDNQLEFHNNSPEKRIIKEYNRKMRRLGLDAWAKEKDSGLTI